MNIVNIGRYLYLLYTKDTENSNTTCLRYDYIISRQVNDFLEVNDLR